MQMLPTLRSQSSVWRKGGFEDALNFIFEFIAWVLHLGNVKIQGSKDSSRLRTPCVTRRWSWKWAISSRMWVLRWLKFTATLDEKWSWIEFVCTLSKKRNGCWCALATTLSTQSECLTSLVLRIWQYIDSSSPPLTQQICVFNIFSLPLCLSARRMCTWRRVLIFPSWRDQTIWSVYSSALGQCVREAGSSSVYLFRHQWSRGMWCRQLVILCISGSCKCAAGSLSSFVHWFRRQWSLPMWCKLLVNLCISGFCKCVAGSLIFVCIFVQT